MRPLSPTRPILFRTLLPYRNDRLYYLLITTKTSKTRLRPSRNGPYATTKPIYHGIYNNSGTNTSSPQLYIHTIHILQRNVYPSTQLTTNSTTTLSTTKITKHANYRYHTINTNRNRPRLYHTRFSKTTKQRCQRLCRLREL